MPSFDDDGDDESLAKRSAPPKEPYPLEMQRHLIALGMPPDKGSFTLDELGQLKHQAALSLTYRGLNCREIVELRKLSDADWAKAAHEYEEFGSAPRWLSISILFGVGAFALMVSDEAGLFASVCAVAAFYRLGFKRGHRIAFFDGYRSGAQRGVDRALGIPDEDLSTVAEFAQDISLYEYERARKQRM